MKRIILLSFFIARLGLAQDPNWDIKENCDESSETLKTISSVSQEECQQNCASEKNCQGFVYVTGWKRCLLKEKMGKQARLRFVSGELDEQRNFASDRLKFDSDHSGKDLERQILDQPEQCAKACISRADCRAFTYLEGYRVCWLKAAGGALRSKIFYCGIHSPAFHQPSKLKETPAVKE